MRGSDERQVPAAPGPERGAGGPSTWAGPAGPHEPGSGAGQGGAGRAARAFEVALWLGIAVGVVARVVRYLDARSLWGDEAQLALNVLQRDFAGLTGPLDYAQTAPLMFLWLERAAVRLFGAGELALRAPVLLSSLAAVGLFAALAHRLLPRRDALVALFLFATNDALIFYASEVKQYGFEVAVVLALWLGLLAARERPLGVRATAALALGGALGVWSAHPAVFVLGAGGLVLAVQALRAGERARFARLVGVGLVWLAAFAWLYRTRLEGDAADPYLREFWALGFAPMPPRSLEELAWYPRTFVAYFKDPLGFVPPGLAAAAALWGALRLGRRDAAAAGMLLGAGALGLLASMLGLYPLRTWPGVDLRDRIYPYLGRVWLFFAPVALLAIAAGLGSLRALWPRRGELAVAGGLGLLSAVALRQLAVNVVSPPPVQELRPVLEAMAEVVRAGDRVWVLRGSEPAFEYYARRIGLRVRAHNVGAIEDDDVRALEGEIAALGPGERVWLVAMHHRAWESARRSERGVVRRLRARAEPADAFEAPGADARLFVARPPTLRGPDAPHPTRRR